MAYCPFCDFEKIKNDFVLYSTKNFFVKAPFGLVTSGHVMLVPFADIRTFSEIPKEIKQEFVELKEKVCQSIKKAFAEPFMLEYGVRLQTVPHAHMHFVPKNGRGYSISNFQEEFVNSSGLPYEIADENRVREVFQKEGEYIRFEYQEKIYLFRTKKIEDVSSLNYRDFFGNKKGLKGVSDWRTLSQDEKDADHQRREETAKLLNFVH